MPARPAGGSVATASVDINVPLSKLARALGQARTTVSNSMRTIGRVIVSSMRRAWTTAISQMARFTRSLRRLARTMATIFLPLGALGGGLAGGVALFKTLQTFANFEQAMARVRAVSGATGKEFDQLMSQAKRLGATTAFSASQAAEAMGNFAVAGFKVDEIMASMTPTLNLAAAGQLDMGTASDIVAKTMRGMGLEAKELTRAVDVMTNAFTTSNTDLVMLGDAFRYVGPIGKAAGKSLEELTAAIQVMSDAGIQGGQAGAALRNILLRLQAQPKEVSDALKKLGVSVGDDAGRMRHLGDIIDDLRKKTARLTPIQRAAYLTQIGGTRAAAALNTLMDSGGDILKRREGLLKKEGTAAKIAAIQLDTFKGSVIILMSALEGAAISLGQALAPAFRKVVTALQPFVGTLGKVLESLKPLADLWGQRMTAAIQAADAWLKDHLQTFERWGQRAAEIVSNVTSAVADLVAWFGKLVGVGGGGMLEGLVGILDQIVEAVAVLTTNPMATFGALTDVIKAGFFYGAEILVKSLRAAFSAFASVFVGAGILIATSWKDILRISWDSLKSLFVWFWDAGRTFFEWVFVGITKAIKTALKLNTEVEKYTQQGYATALALQLGKRPEGWGDLAKRYGEAVSIAYGGISGLLKRNFTGGIEGALHGKGDAAMDAAAKKWGAASAEAAAKRPAAMTPWEEMWRKVGETIPSLPGRAVEVGKDVWHRMEAGVKAAGGPAKPLLPSPKGAGQMMGIQQYLSQLQAGLSKQDKIDDVAKNTADTHKDLKDGGHIHKALTAIADKVGKPAAFA